MNTADSFARAASLDNDHKNRLAAGLDLPFDPSVPHPARVYGYWLGSKDHYRADRKAAEEVAGCRPQVVAGARANRVFLARAVGYLAGERGIGQFLDVGPGLPAPGATHRVAQAIAPQSKIVYVDNDPLVLAHARALLKSMPEGCCAHRWRQPSPLRRGRADFV